MRSDYILHALAIVFFTISIISVVALAGTSQIILISASTLLGIISLGLGLTQRHRHLQTNQTSLPPTPSPQEPTQSPKIENLPSPPVPKQPETSITNPPTNTALAAKELEVTTIQPVPVASVPAVIPEQPATLVPVQQPSLPQKGTALTEVSGIGEKRASQLKILGVKTAEDLANASVNDLAKKLKISAKIVSKWVAAAKELTKIKSS